MPEFYKRLVLQKKTIFFVLLMAFAMAVVCGASLLILLFNALNGMSSWQESTAFYAIACLLMLTSVSVFVGIAILYMRRPTMADLTTAVEKSRPELMESLTSAVEIQATKGGAQSPLEDALIRKVEADTEAINFTTTILPQILHPLWVVALGIGMTLLSDWAVRSEVLHKASAHLADVIAEESTGLIVKPRSVEQPVGADLVVETEIKRWQKEAKIIYREKGATETFSMSISNEGKGSFTFYGLSSDIEYRVKTPSLQSPWYKISVYDPPDIKTLNIDINPPSYTGEAPRQFTRLLDLFITEGSSITFDLTTDAGVEGAIIVGETDTPLIAKTDDEGKRHLRATVSPRRDTDYHIRLINQDERTLVTKTFKIEVTPDELPVIEIIEPGKDLEDIKPDDAVPLELYAADDYGLQRIEIRISVSGLERMPIVVYQMGDEAIREETFLSMIEIQQLGVEYGDVVAYHAVAIDIKAPEPQEVHSEMYFIEITEGVPDQEQQGMEGMSGETEEEEEVDFRAMIIELKRIIRLTHKTQFLKGEDRVLNSVEIGSALAALHTEANSVLSKATEQLMQIEGGEVYLDFKGAVEHIKEAEELVNTDYIAEALPLEQEALSELLSVETYFKAQKPPPSQGQSGEQSASAENDQPEEEQDEEKMTLGEMKKTLEGLSQLVDKQNTMNTRLERADRSGTSEQERSELAGLQTEIKEDAESLYKLLRKYDEAKYAAEQLRISDREMTQAATATLGDEMGRATRSGLRAKDSLLAASALMEDMLHEAASRSVSSLANTAKALAKSEAAAAEKSREAQESGASEEKLEQLQQEQQGFERIYQQLQAKMDRTALDLEDVFPEAGEALMQAQSQSEANKIGTKMERASKALQYEMFRRAVKAQEDSAKGLTELSESIQAAAESIPQFSIGDARRLLEKIAQAEQQASQEQSGQQPGEEGEDGQEGSEGQGEQGEQGQSGQNGQEGEGELAQSGQQGQSGQGENGQQPGEQPGEQGQGGQGGEGPDGEQGGKGFSMGTGEKSSESEPAWIEEIGGEISGAAQLMKNIDLAKLGQELQASTEHKAGSYGEGDTKLLLQQTKKLLQQFIRESMVGDRARLNQRNAPPPEKYRRLVEEYFKELAEEK